MLADICWSGLNTGKKRGESHTSGLLQYEHVSTSKAAAIGQKLPPLLFKVGNCQSAKAITEFVTRGAFRHLTY